MSGTAVTSTAVTGTTCTDTGTTVGDRHRPHAVLTRTVLGAVAIAWPLWSVVSVTQVVTRSGFDITRHPLSALATGALGAVQIVNFLVAGLLLTVGATGLRRVLPGPWVPRLVRGAGLGMLAAGMLVMDPMNGFPTGAPSGMPASMSWHSIGHMVAGTISFVCMIAACYAWARRFRLAGRRGLAVGSTLAGTALLLGDGWATTGAPMGSLTLAVGAIACGLWISTAAIVESR